jgi:predicted permease
MLLFRSALRSLLKSPMLTMVSAVSLALGIGANAAIFSVFHQTMLRTLPVAVPEQLVTFSSPGPKQGRVSTGSAGGGDAVFRYDTFRDLERTQSAFTAIAAHRTFSANIGDRAGAVNKDALLVSGSYFPVLGVRPAIGRLLTPADDRTPGEHHVAVLSYEFWQSQFAGDSAVLNQQITVNGERMTVVGVTQRGFTGTTLEEPPNIYVPLTMTDALHMPYGSIDAGRDYWLYLIARLKPGISSESAESSINGAYAAIVRDIELPLQGAVSDRFREQFLKKRIVLSDGARGEQAGRENMTPVFMMLFSVTGFVVLIACANIANLLIVRGISRASEFAVRLSLGAGRAHLIAQVLIEALMLAAVGSAASFLVMRWTLALLPGVVSGPEQFALEIDGTLVVFVVCASIITALLIGLIPALHISGVPVISTLKTQGGGQARSRMTGFFRSGLATAQIAMALALIVVAGLFARSLANIGRVNLGMNADQLTMFRVSPGLNGYSDERSRLFFERVEDELAALPGVTSVGASLIAFLGGDNASANVTVEGFTAGPDADMDASLSLIGPGLFRTLGVPLVAGREFTRADSEGSQSVAIVNEAFARKFNLGRNAVGRRMQLGRSNTPNLDIEIVGLVQDAKYSSVKADVPPQFFRPYTQLGDPGAMTFYVRSTGDESQVLSAVPRVVADLDPVLPVEMLQTMTAQVREGAASDRVISRLSAAFAGLATLLAAIGLYGVLAYGVAQRTPEIGVRMALGADAARIRRMVLGQVGRVALVGAVAGSLAAVALGRVAGSLLFGLSGVDPLVLTGAVLGVAAVALAAGAIPAYRASRVQPIRALRYE